MLRTTQDEMDDRAIVEASENTGLAQGPAGADLHQIDPGRVTQTLRSAKHARGYDRLEVMLNAVLPRLVNEPRIPKSG
jgi:hypothetical protein